jgi:hypothetical protein
MACSNFTMQMYVHTCNFQNKKAIDSIQLPFFTISLVFYSCSEDGFDGITTFVFRLDLHIKTV